MIVAAAALQELLKAVTAPAAASSSSVSRIVDGAEEEGWLSWESLGLQVKVSS